MSTRNSTRHRRAVRSLKHKGRRGAKVPELQGILYALGEALCLVQAAHIVLRHTDQWGPAEVALRDGIEGLKVVREDLDGAETRLQGFRRVPR